jgi:signal peptidase I
MLKPVRLAFIVAIVLGLLSLVGSILNPVALLAAVFYIVAAVGLWRNAVWCGYGPALWLAVQVPATVFAVVADSKLLGGQQLGTLLGGTLINSLAAWTFYRAGRALAAAGSPRSFAAPWIVLTVISAALSVAAVLLLPYATPTGSMEKTLLIGDLLFVPRFGSSVPARGDVIVFHYPVDPKETFVKRVIGLPGDRIQVINKEVYLNRHKLEEPYAVHTSSYIDSYRDNFPGDPNVSLDRRATAMLRDHVANGEVEVPPNSYFVLGDNRDSSLDSRYWGFVPTENVIGKP